MTEETTQILICAVALAVVVLALIAGVTTAQVAETQYRSELTYYKATCK